MISDYFPEAFESWIPKLIDIEKRKADGEPEYQNVGFSALVFPTGATNLSARRATLETRFNERYYNRMINSETLPRWQIRLQNRFDEIADRYERAYQVYSEYAEEMDNDILEGWKDIASGNDTKEFLGSEKLTYAGSEELTKSGSEELTRSGKEKTTEGGKDETKSFRNDTPDSTINASASYADAAERGETDYGHTTETEFTNRKDTTAYNNRKDTRSFTGRNDERSFDERKDKTTYGKTITRILTGNNVLDNVNYSIEHWMDIDTLFVKEFENLFLNVFWY